MFKHVRTIAKVDLKIDSANFKLLSFENINLPQFILDSSICVETFSFSVSDIVFPKTNVETAIRVNESSIAIQFIIFKLAF